MSIKHHLKQSVLFAAEWGGVNRFFRWKTRNNVLGLCYHGVIDDDAPWTDLRTRIAVSATQFERQMQEIRRHWNPISLSELDECFQTGRKIHDNAVFVSFDDGFENNLSVAAPILRRYDIPATVFLTTGLIGTQNTIWPLEFIERIIQMPVDHQPMVKELSVAMLDIEHLPTEPEIRRAFAALFLERCKSSIPASDCQQILGVFRQHGEFRMTESWQRQLYTMLDWDGVRKLREQRIEIGAHTVTHGNLARQTTEESEDEMRQSKAEIEKRLGTDCFSVAYPFGDAEAYSDSVVGTAKKLDFRIGVTLRNRRNPATPAPLRLDRICVTSDLSLASFRSLIAGWRT